MIIPAVIAPTFLIILIIVAAAAAIVLVAFAISAMVVPIAATLHWTAKEKKKSFQFA